VVAVVVPLFLVVAGDASPLERIASLAGASGDIRWTVWRDAMAAWRAHPVWGTGLGSFATAVLPFSDRATGYFFARAENEYIDLLVEGGLVGLAIALAGLAAAVRLAARAPGSLLLPSDRALVLGGWFAGLALLVHWLCDFSLHVPGVAITAVVLCGFLCRLGSDARGSSRPPRPCRRAGVVGGGLVSCGLAAAIVLHGYRQARAEAQLWGAGLPPPDSSLPTAEMGRGLARPDLARIERALAAALRWRPDWAEGHLRLGLVRIRLYEQDAAELVRQVETDPEQAAVLASPLWLHGRAHPGPEEEAVPVEAFLEHDPVRQYLVPAASSFLEARRCAPVLALPHAELGLLDFLLVGGGSTAVYIERALAQAGSGRSVLELAAALAVSEGDLALAGRCWGRLLRADPAAWEAVAATAGSVLPPEVLLESVLPPDDGRLPLLFAEQVYTGDELKDGRTRFFRAALERLPGDPGLSDAERLALEARALAGLDDREPALGRMNGALALEPLRSDWRGTLVGWLVAWNRLEEAHRQVLIGLRLDPGDAGLVAARETVAEALARGPRPAAAAGRSVTKIDTLLP
jgi:hypothetical protein